MRSDEELAHEHLGSTPREDFVAAGEPRFLRLRLWIRAGAWPGRRTRSTAITWSRSSPSACPRNTSSSCASAACRTCSRASVTSSLQLALEKIGARFGVQTLLLEGGGRINGAMLRAGLVDEVSLLIAPVADGRIGTPALFDVDGGDDEVVRPWRLALEAVERSADDVLWLRYRVEPGGWSTRLAVRRSQTFKLAGHWTFW